MSRTLTLEIPDKLYQALTELANQEGKAAEDVGATWLAATIERIANDPLMSLSGVLNSGVPDLAERYDYYIGSRLVDEVGN